MNMMMAQSMLCQKQKTLASADIAKEDELAGSIASTAQGIKDQFGGNVPRGSKITRGGATIDLIHNRDHTLTHHSTAGD
jgi:hypothetical protein